MFEIVAKTEGGRAYPWRGSRRWRAYRPWEWSCWAYKSDRREKGEWKSDSWWEIRDARDGEKEREGRSNVSETETWNSSMGSDLVDL